MCVRRFDTGGELLEIPPVKLGRPLLMPQCEVRLPEPEEKRRRRLRLVRRLEGSQRFVGLADAERLGPGVEELARVGGKKWRGEQQREGQQPRGSRHAIRYEYAPVSVNGLQRHPW